MYTDRLRPSPIRAILDRQRASGLISLAGGLPAPDLFPLRSLATAAEAAAHTPATWQYAGSCGHPDLRAWVGRRLARRGLVVDPDQVLITNGSQHALLLAALALLDPGSVVAVESPGYPGAYQALAITGAEVIGIPADPQALADLARRRALALVQCMPSGQNPTGRTLDAGQRQALASVCGNFGLTVLEDDAYGELWYGTPPPPPLAVWHPRTLYVGSFSKVLAPGLRLGWMVVPRDLLPKLMLALQASALHANGLAQATVLEWLQREDLDAHLQDLRATYRQRRDALLDGLARNWSGPQPEPPRCGMFLWLPVPAGWSGHALAEDAHAAGVAVVPGGGCLAQGSPDDHVRLCFATETPERLAMAARILGGCGAAQPRG